MRDGIDFLVIQIGLVILIEIGIDTQLISISIRNKGLGMWKNRMTRMFRRGAIPQAARDLLAGILIRSFQIIIQISDRDPHLNRCRYFANRP